jgi:hypothetical protein
MLLSPGWFPLQSKTLCPERYLLPTFLHYVEIQLVVRRRTAKATRSSLFDCIPVTIITNVPCCMSYIKSCGIFIL